MTDAKLMTAAGVSSPDRQADRAAEEPRIASVGVDRVDQFSQSAEASAVEVEH